LVRLYLGLIDRDPVRTTDVLIELGTLEPSVNRSLVEKGLELSISSLHGQKVDRMQVKALQELANRTLSRFPFKLPKNLALYMRMASILEGIYLHHKVKFQFVRVLSNLLEEEGLVKDAYVEEVKRMIMKYARAIESSSEFVPMLRQYLNDRNEMNFTKRNNFLIPSAILSAAIFVGSALIFPYSISASTVGIISSSVIMCGAILYTRFYR
jgi:predicted unusual protein kinase regulating ubiquinone biosynthesis (AarF/ABC1/UbiB family)